MGTSDLSINGNLHYPNDKDRSLNEAAADKILKYRSDYKNNPPISTAFMPAIASTSGRLRAYNGKFHGSIAQAELLKLQKSGQFPYEPARIVI